MLATLTSARNSVVLSLDIIGVVLLLFFGNRGRAGLHGILTFEHRSGEEDKRALALASLGPLLIAEIG